jgi:hypothetical protein
MSLSDICNGFVNTAKLKDDVEKNIIEFAEAPWGLGLGIGDVPPLFPVQKFIFKCSYNIPLNNEEKTIIIKDRFNEQERFRFSELEYLHFLYEEGRINIKEVTGDPADTRSNLLLVIGRRGLKTSSIAVMVAYETYKLLRKISPQEYYRIMPDDEIRVSCIATNQEQAAELFRRITGHLDRSEYFRKYRNKPTLSYMQLSTQRDLDQYNGRRPSIRLVASPCSGRGLRGHNNIIAILDEMAYFFESETSADKSDAVIYEAVTPSTVRFNSPTGESHGKTIAISSPGARAGKFFDLYQNSLKPGCNNWLMIQAPTWEVDPTLPSKILRSKYVENPISYDNEYGAEFSDRVSAWIENEQILRLNIIPGLKPKKMSYERIPHFMGIDVGLKNDGTAVAICHIVKKDVGGVLKDCIELDCAEVRYASEEKKDYFQPDEMAEWILTFTEKFFIVKGMMDQYYGLAMLPVFHKAGQKQLVALQVSRDYSSKVYQNLMSKMLDGSLRIPEGEDRVVDGKRTKDSDLVLEMLKLQAVQHSKYMITVEAPEVKGLHDDLSDAFSRAVFLATEYLSTGGGVSRNNVVESASGSGISYRQYYMKQKRTASYTNRPSSSLQQELSSRRQISSAINRISSTGRR